MTYLFLVTIYIFYLYYFYRLISISDRKLSNQPTVRATSHASIFSPIFYYLLAIIEEVAEILIINISIEKSMQAQKCPSCDACELVSPLSKFHFFLVF